MLPSFWIMSAILLGLLLTKDPKYSQSPILSFRSFSKDSSSMGMLVLVSSFNCLFIQIQQFSRGGGQGNNREKKKLKEKSGGGGRRGKKDPPEYLQKKWQEISKSQISRVSISVNYSVHNELRAP